jgi:GDP-4-dehydro-6-deoxy-D-mannose reductase
MMPRRILLTGAAGFVGTHLRPVLATAFPGAEIIGISQHPHAGLTSLDVTDVAAVTTMVRHSRPDACIHLAAIAASRLARRNPDAAWRVNLHGTLALARAILETVPDCVFLFVSSSEIYGRSFRSGGALQETALLEPVSTYAATKAAADIAVGALVTEGLRAIRVRPFNHTGPGQSAEYVVAAFARQMARIASGLQAPVLKTGALDVRRDFLDVRDVCAAYAACLARADALEPGIILNIASGTPRRIGDVLAELLALAEVEAGVDMADTLLRPAEIPTAAGDASRARAVLDWRPTISWETTLSDVLADWWARANEEAIAH